MIYVTINRNCYDTSFSIRVGSNPYKYLITVACGLVFVNDELIKRDTVVDGFLYIDVPYDVLGLL